MTVTAVAMQPGIGGGAAPSLADVRALLEAAAPLDPCDPTIGQWQYAPGPSGTFTSSTGTFTLDLYLGGRGVLAWPDGTAVMFDYGPPVASVPADARGSVHRDWHRDAECRRDRAHPHFVGFAPTGGTEVTPVVTALGQTCVRMGPDDAMNIANWCCP